MTKIVAVSLVLSGIAAVLLAPRFTPLWPHDQRPLEFTWIPRHPHDPTEPWHQFHTEIYNPGGNGVLIGD